MAPNASRDSNYVTTLMGVSSADGVTPVLVQVDPVTGRVLVQTSASGQGTVTYVSVATANGISGSVATATTTPVITLTLGAITPTSVNGLTISNTTGTFTLTNAKTLSVSNTLTFTGTDGSSVNFGTGGTVVYTTLFGTGVQTALAVNVGSAGAFVVFGGALGTPSSGTLTNCVGLPAASIVAGIIGVTGTRMTKIWTTDIESTNMPTVGGVAILTSLTAPQFTTIELGHASDTTISRVSAGVIAVEGAIVPTKDANANLTINNLIEGYTTTATAAGTTTMVVGDTFQQYWTGTTTQTIKLPTTGVVAGQQWSIVNNSTGLVTVQSSGANTIIILGAGQSAIFTANVATPTTAANWTVQLIDCVGINNTITASSNAATINLAYKTNVVTNNSAATITITLPTAGAVDGMVRALKVVDSSAAAQTLTLVNTENSSINVPATTNGSTTLPLTMVFQYNGLTSKWRYLGYA